MRGRRHDVHRGGARDVHAGRGERGAGPGSHPRVRTPAETRPPRPAPSAPAPGRLLLAVPPHLQRAGRTTAELRDYADATWLSALPSSGFQAATELLCRAEGFEPDITFRSDQYELLLQLVAADFGVALIPALAAAPRKGVAYLEVTRPTGLTHDIHITTREADTSPAVEALSALLVQRGIDGGPAG
ncbi:LysR substrate-binding domain-containing protein [Streptomyces sp. GD-15H]|uniref:LysR substrate-binding domain-containing protein n=1 Tax=Streptomyces sp. GD-15H TaxID=3129112 RepID=UPI00324F30FC